MDADKFAARHLGSDVVEVGLKEWYAWVSKLFYNDDYYHEIEIALKEVKT